MFEKLKNLDFKAIAKIGWVGILIIIFLVIVLWLVSALLSSLNLNFFRGGYNEYGTSYNWVRDLEMGKSMSKQDSINYTESSVPNDIPASNYDVKSYNVSIETSEIEKDCSSILNWLNVDYIKKDNVNQGKHYCNFQVKVLKWKEQQFIDFLNKYKVKDLNANITNIVKSYTNLADKISETKKRLTEIEELLANSKASYDELWNSLKIKEISAESIDALNKIILNKSELISKFTKERESLVDTINMYTKQKQDYDEQIKYIDFNISVTERKLVDFQSFKDAWYNDYKQLVYTFNETFRNLTVNLLSFLLKTINVVVYAVLSIFFILIWGKGLYRMGRRIINWKKL
ncbi:MAG: hypothetical protein ACD_3C00027G0002 [uncultured bacterium (gcode 4)]|uniref:Uncharacterized protein n=1 Tax=uncultured bacterium (gcode 4) TaxID=1234023 RepID=K2GEN3_9BACT|nr:MAG: hypothetical protein ACD_3C00027G0002 [uncultured bacterium (gcode 4)]